MSRELTLKVVMIVIGLFFLAGIYPLVMFLWFWPHANDIVPMFLSLYVTLGVFMLIAARSPTEHRSLIWFTAWSSFAHTGVMLAQAYKNVSGRPELFGMSAVLIVIGLLLIVLMPAQPASVRGGD
ncbi:hypothetical protein DWU98_11155 [Dyella monticola]|uniref:Uncharacterized protein n=1 Tax=Dyella monticola TaxID=1927958 RepID=A0A370WYK3_9GAMM|nr:DUF6632 domain-containing protein [Dyella monticola]RDS81101.1 hypothetical protein DWU98_11155 [Dyella monticola]